MINLVPKMARSIRMFDVVCTRERCPGLYQNRAQQEAQPHTHFCHRDETATACRQTALPDGQSAAGGVTSSNVKECQTVFVSNANWSSLQQHAARNEIIADRQHLFAES